MTVRELIRQTAQRFESAGIPDPKLDAEWLLSSVTGQEMLMLRLNGSDTVPEAQLVAYEQLVLRRLQREPLQYLLGSTPFFGRMFHTDRRALIPRPETTLLAERAVNAIRCCKETQPQVLDLCCGSGCIGITLALECPHAAVSACDLSPNALSLSRENAAALGANVCFAQGDLFGAWPEDAAWDVIVSNPPYIPTEDCRTLQAEVLREPCMALDGGSDGLDFYRRIAAEAPQKLKKGGVLLLEIGIGEADAICSLLTAAGLTDTAVYPDQQGILRIVEARN